MSGKNRRAAALAVGDELLAGIHPDLNSPRIAVELARLGIQLEEVRVVGDGEAEIAGSVQELASRFPLLLVTGGLGPTLDDVTRHAIAEAAGRELRLSAETLRELEAWFAGRGSPMPAANARQALFPAGAERIPNRLGTAPGFRIELGDCTVVSLPGPPAEMRAVLSEEVLPWLVATGRGGAPLAEKRFHLFGLSESLFAERAGAWMERDASPRMGCSAKEGVLHVVLRARGADEASRSALARRARAFRERFAEHVFSESQGRLELVLGAALLRSGVSVTTAESCTGGLVADLLTAVPGISAVFREGWVTYSNRAKTTRLGVSAELIERSGAVSEEVARSMAAGAAAASGARLALAVTGVAGPSGGSVEKPVGLVWFASALDGVVRASVRRFPPGERERIRTLAARTSLFLALRRLREEGVVAPD